MNLFRIQALFASFLSLVLSIGITHTMGTLGPRDLRSKIEGLLRQKNIDQKSLPAIRQWKSEVENLIDQAGILKTQFQRQYRTKLNNEGINQAEARLALQEQRKQETQAWEQEQQTLEEWLDLWGNQLYDLITSLENIHIQQQSLEQEKTELQSQNEQLRQNLQNTPPIDPQRQIISENIAQNKQRIVEIEAKQREQDDVLQKTETLIEELEQKQLAEAREKYKRAEQNLDRVTSELQTLEGEYQKLENLSQLKIAELEQQISDAQNEKAQIEAKNTELQKEITALNQLQEETKNLLTSVQEKEHRAEELRTLKAQADELTKKREEIPKVLLSMWDTIVRDMNDAYTQWGDSYINFLTKLSKNTRIIMLLDETDKYLSKSPEKITDNVTKSELYNRFRDFQTKLIQGVNLFTENAKDVDMTAGTAKQNIVTVLQNIENLVNFFTLFINASAKWALIDEFTVNKSPLIEANTLKQHLDQINEIKTTLEKTLNFLRTTPTVVNQKSAIETDLTLGDAIDIILGLEGQITAIYNDANQSVTHRIIEGGYKNKIEEFQKAIEALMEKLDTLTESLSASTSTPSSSPQDVKQTTQPTTKPVLPYLYQIITGRQSTQRQPPSGLMNPEQSSPIVESLKRNISKTPSPQDKSHSSWKEEEVD